MRFSWMISISLGIVLLGPGCGQEARNAPSFQRDANGQIIRLDEGDGGGEDSDGKPSSESPIADSADHEPDFVIGSSEPDAEIDDWKTPPDKQPEELFPDMRTADVEAAESASDLVPEPPDIVIPTEPHPLLPKKMSVPPKNTSQVVTDTPVKKPVPPNPEPSVEVRKSVRREGLPTEQKGYSPERVFFATNRAPEHNSEALQDPDLYFSGDRGSLVYGKCEVSIPYKRSPGTLPEPSILRFEFSQDPAKHVVLMEIDMLPNAEFWKQLRADVESSQEKQLMLFVHGYCATFRDAARRTAQMSYDMNYQGPAMFFSWPAGSDSEKFSEKANYLKDLRRAEESDEDLIGVLQGISRYSGATRIHLVAHSMGNYVLTEALKTMDDRRPSNVGQMPLFDQIALAAPDLDSREFVERTAQRILPFSKRFTVYASTEDKALKLSRSVNGYQPLGFLNEYTRRGAQERLFDLVDVSQLTTGWFDSGHIYYGDMPEMISDISYLFRGIQATSLQRGLAETPPMFRLARRGQ